MSLSFIAQMGWKSALISGAALLLVALLRKRSAADRAALLRVGILLLLLLPVISLVLPALKVETAPVAASAQAFDLTPLPVADLSSVPATMAAPAEASIWHNIELLAGLAYAAGLLLVGLRLGIGILTLRRWTRTAREVTASAWTDALARSAKSGQLTPLLLASDDVASPMSWGLRQPVILLDSDALARPEDAGAIIAHEMAHVTRGDWLALVMARAAVAIFWFNPLVWLLEREVMQQAEEAADSHALAQVEPARYAQTLVTCARQRRARVPANSIAASGNRLTRRVRAILDGRGIGTASGSRWTIAAMIGCIGFAAPVAALQLIPAAPPAPAAPAAPRAPAAALAPMVALAAQAPAAPATPAAPKVPEAPAKASYFSVDIDEDATEQSAEEAGRAAERAAEAAERVAEQADRIAERAAREGERAAREGERIAREGERIAAQASRAAAAGLRAGAEGMLKGADSMEAGARQMDEAAVNLRSREYREKQIAQAAARGQRVTHEELIAAIPEMEKGAREMRQGAREMRENAAQMRRQAM